MAAWSMNLNSVSILSLLTCFFCTITTSSSNNPSDPTHSSGEVSINCGSTGTFSARNGREWHGDGHKFSSLVEIKGSSTTSHVINQKLISDPVPYKTARISRSRFSYKLLINPGQKILRFHFSSSLYQGFKQYKDLFDVEAGAFTLLRNFSVTLAADALGVNSLVKEFCLDIKENQLFNITFSPTTSQFGDTYAFINGIEIVSVPANRPYFHIQDAGVQFIGKSPVFIDGNTALEIIRRLNTQQEFVSLSTDNGGNGFQIRGTVPEQEGNKVNNFTWKLPVDVGFRYVVRVHFSRLGFKIAEIGGFMFEVLINGMAVTTNLDKFIEREEDSIDWYRDYLVVMNGRKQVGKRDLLISLLSNDEFLEGHGLLKEFEILKLSNTDDNSLASLNPLRFTDSPFYPTLQTLPKVLGHKNTMVHGAILVLVLNIIAYAFWMIRENGHVEEENTPSVKAGRLCRRFSLSEIQLATKNFSRPHLIGRGGFGNVYKGTIDNQTVAIKRLKSNSSQGEREFFTEIETLTELRHVNLVSLIGYCNECKEMILVYEYMPSGSLADYLFKLVWDDEGISSLTWKQRLNICIGAGRGLDYLHTGASIIHRDVKASNILLDEDFTAKVADFGLAKPLISRKLEQSHVSTKVKGTLGYWDPEYFVTGKLTRKSDTYAFGVVLLEVLCGRRAIDRGYLEEEQVLTKWALECISKGETERIVDSNLKDGISDKSLKAFVGVAERCLHNEPKKRPTMAEVVLQLQFVLELQESATYTYTVSNYERFFNDIHRLNDETPCSSSSVQLVKASVDENLLMPPVKVQSDDRLPAYEDENTQKLVLNHQFDNNVENFDPPSGKKHGGKIRIPKISRLWPFRNKGVPSVSDAYLGKMRLFTLMQIRVATNNFDAANKIGEGRFGPIYKGHLHDGTIIVVKQLSSNSWQWNRKFFNELAMISAVQHPHLVKLYGWSIVENQLLLVYEYMKNSSLARALFGPEERQLHLDWPTRHKICMGIARGLAYLHGESRLKIIPRDIKATNVLLDKNLTPKISDFGLAKLSTRIAGTIGYMAPEYALQGYLTDKADVYSFGVVLLEIVAGRSNTIRKPNNNECIFLPHWANSLKKKGSLLELVDRRLGSKFNEKEIIMTINLAILCTNIKFMKRPTMSEVVSIFEGKTELKDMNKRVPLPIQKTKTSILPII